VYLPGKRNKGKKKINGNTPAIFEERTQNKIVIIISE
jgi:hypothetical protein